MASGRKRGAGERVLEGRHVIGLFLLMLLFSAVFFSLGYVMARNQYAGQVRADGGKDGLLDAPVIGKPEIAPKRTTGKASAAKSSSASGSTTSSGATNSPGSASAPAAAPVAVSDWEQFSTPEKPKQSESHLKTAAPGAMSSAPKVPSASTTGNTNSKPTPTSSDSPRATQSSGGYTLQVIAVRRQADAMDLARRLQKKKFPAFVLSPQGNKLYRVQVGPYADQKSAEAAKKGLENAGFKAIVKHG
jgi:cell division septation protein DedD